MRPEPYPICGNRMCDHTLEDRGGPLDAKIPRYPTVAAIIDRQGALCHDCQRGFSKMAETIPVPDAKVQTIVMVCPPCYRKRVA